jgi:hypothetical protein
LSPAERASALKEIAAGAFDRVGPLIGEVAAALHDDSRFRVSSGLLGTLREDKIYTRRIAQLAVEQFTSERLAPELRIAAELSSPDDIDAALPGTVNFVVLFDTFTNFTNELYPLIIDALESDAAARGKPVINVLGVQADWWNDNGEIFRAIFLQQRDHTLMESGLEKPLRPGVALFLCMDRVRHRELSQKANSLGICEINPWEPAARIADDKFECFRRWSAAGVPTPPAILFPRSTPRPEWEKSLEEKKREWGKDGAGIIVQPNRGTEGRGAEYFPPGATIGPVLEHAVRLSRDDDVLIRKEIRGLRFLPGEGAEPVPFDLRINVTWDGASWYAESGYLQTAGNPSDPITSAGRGGRIVMFSRDPFNRLVAWEAEGYRPIPLAAKDDEYIRAVATRAALAAGETGLIGIDLRLVTTPGGQDRSVDVFVLDANPRPAGLSHSEFLPGAGRNPEPGVSRRLWHLVRSD